MDTAAGAVDTEPATDAAPTDEGATTDLAVLADRVVPTAPATPTAALPRTDAVADDVTSAPASPANDAPTMRALAAPTGDPELVDEAPATAQPAAPVAPLEMRAPPAPPLATPAPSPAATTVLSPEDLAYSPRRSRRISAERLLGEIDRRLAGVESGVRRLRRDLAGANGAARVPDRSLRELNGRLDPLTHALGRLDRAIDESDASPGPDVREGLDGLAARLDSTRASLTDLARELIVAGGDHAQLARLVASIGRLDAAGRALSGRGDVKQAAARSLVASPRAPSEPGWPVAAPQPAARADGAAEIYATAPRAPVASRPDREQTGQSQAPERNRAPGANAAGAASGSVAPGTGNFGASVAALFVLAALALAGLSMRLAASPPNWRSVIVVAPLERPG